MSLSFLDSAIRALARGATYDGGDQGAYQTAFRKYRGVVGLLPCNVSAPGTNLYLPRTQGQVTMHFNWMRRSVEKEACMRLAVVWAYEYTRCLPINGSVSAVVVREQQCQAVTTLASQRKLPSSIFPSQTSRY